jgi:triacylglycerol esterase/lipase EstA (alpha/beta hydrolase family)
MKRTTIAVLLVALWTVPMAAQNNVALVHGFLEGPANWGNMPSLLSGAGFNAFTVPTVNSSDPIATQSTALNSYLSTNGVTNSILVGHSQGGLVSRYATRSQAARGILTVATPNGGAPIAGAG